MIKVVEKKIHNEDDFNKLMENNNSFDFRCVETGDINPKKYKKEMKTFFKMVNFNDR